MFVICGKGSNPSFSVQKVHMEMHLKTTESDVKWCLLWFFVVEGLNAFLSFLNEVLEAHSLHYVSYV